MKDRVTYRGMETGDIPDDWRTEVFSGAVEVNPKRSLVVGKEYAFIPMEALATDSPRVGNIQKRVWNRSSGSKFQNGDVLLARITPSAENGKTALVDYLDGDGKGFGSTEFIVLSPKVGGIEESIFLFYLIAFGGIRNQAIQRMAGSTGRQRIPAEAFDDILCPVPSPPEQRKIGSILSVVDDALQKTGEVIAKTQQLKKGLVQRLLTKGIGHARFKKGEIGEIPDEWDVARIEEFGDVVTGVTPSTSVRDYYGVDYPFVSPLDLGKSKEVKTTRKKVTEKGLHIGRPIPPGSVLTTCISSIDGIGKAGLSTSICLTNQQINSVICHQDADPDFLYYCIDFHRERIKSFAARSSGHFAIISKSTFSKILMPRPPKTEQQKIASILSTVDTKIEDEQSEMTKLGQLKKGLMQTLLMGKVRVKVN